MGFICWRILHSRLQTKEWRSYSSPRRDEVGLRCMEGLLPGAEVFELVSFALQLFSLLAALLQVGMNCGF